MAGARAATGEIVLLLDDDVLVAPGTVRGHARAHASGDRLMVVGAMPVAGGPQSDADDYARVMYAREYRRHSERWQRDPDTVLTTLWAGHLSLRRSDLLSVEPPNPAELARGYHSDVDFGLRCRRAGLTGVYDPSLRAEHLYARGSEAFIRDARNSARSRHLLHQTYPSELGPYTQRELLASVPRPLRPAVALARTRRWPERAVDAAMSGLGRVRLYRLQRGAAYMRKWMEQMHELPAGPRPAGGGGDSR